MFCTAAPSSTKLRPNVNDHPLCPTRLAQAALDLSAPSTEQPLRRSVVVEDTSYRAIAIVGAGAILPDAPNVPAFWENIKSGRYSVTDVDPQRWDPQLYYDPDPKAPDKSYSKIGGWVREYPWEPEVAFGRSSARGRCHGRGAEVGYRLHPRGAGRLRLSQASPGSGSHRSDPGQRHGRGKALPDGAANFLSGVRP